MPFAHLTVVFLASFGALAKTERFAEQVGDQANEDAVDQVQVESTCKDIEIPGRQSKPRCAEGRHQGGCNGYPGQKVGTLRFLRHPNHERCPA